MMPEWHQFESSSTMSEQQELAKKKNPLKLSSRSFWFSTGLLASVTYKATARRIINCTKLAPCTGLKTLQ